MRTLLLATVLLAAGILGVVWWSEGERGPRVRLVTTTSTANAGLLDYLLEPFQEETGVDVIVVAVGTGQALALGQRGDADLILVHARAREDAFVAAGHGIDRRDVMWNDFVILGPPEDPAGIRGTADPAEALRKLHAAGAPFISRGDDSGTHIRERSYWKAADLEPTGHSAYLEVGQGMGKCLVMADEKRAYTLSDRGTYLAFKGRIELDVLVEGHASLRNPYGAILINPERHPGVNADAARRLLDFLTSPEGQRRIGSFRVDGEVLFHPVRAP